MIQGPASASGAGLCFASPFDDALAHAGPPAVFLRDREGAWKVDASWTRDAWSRDPGPHAPGWTWTLCRDRASGYVWLVLATSPTLLRDHPRLDTRTCADLAEAWTQLSALGAVPIAPEAW